MKIEGKRVLVTGGSSGIGRAITAALLAKGAWVVITGRRQDALDAAVAELKAKGDVHGICADVTEAARRAATLDGAPRWARYPRQQCGGACAPAVWRRRARLKSAPWWRWTSSPPSC